MDRLKIILLRYFRTWKILHPKNTEIGICVTILENDTFIDE